MRHPLILIFAFLATPSWAQEAYHDPNVQFLDFGAFCALETVEQEEAEDTISGVVNLVDGLPEIRLRGHLVPAQIGVGFGVMVGVEPGMGGPVTIETIHPPMGEKSVVRETWVADYIDGDIAYNGFTFEFPYELVTGEWTITASRAGRVIYRVDFNVVDPRLAPQINCARGLLS